MSAKANYFKIGLFFIISSTLGVVAVVIWGAELFTKDKIYFETYFDSAVTGLTPGATVELMGVKIGKVERIEFASAVYPISTDPTIVSEYERYVRVLCSMSAEKSIERVGEITNEQREARVKNLIQQGLRLQLASNILTGQAYLKGTFLDMERFPILDIKWEPEHTYVPSAPGSFSTMKHSVDKILVRLEEIDIKAIANNVNKILVEIKQLLTSSDPTAESVNLPQMMARLDSILERIDRQTANKNDDIERIILNIKAITDDLKELTTMLKEYPSEIIFSQPPAKSELIK